MPKEMYMDDVADISCEAIDYITERLNQYGIDVSEDLDIQDNLYATIFDFIEDYCINGYRNYN